MQCGGGGGGGEDAPERLKRWPMERDQPMLWISGLYMWHQKSSEPSSHSS